MSKHFYKILSLLLLFITILIIFLFTLFLSKNQIKAKKKNESTVESHKELTLNLVGDLFLDRDIEKVIKRRGHKFLFHKIKTQLADADITFANLEGPASYLGTPYQGKPPIITFRADPAMLYQLLIGGIDIVSLANNHINDHYEPALLETIQLLDLLNIKSFGAGKNNYQARKPAILEVNDYKLAFLGYADAIWSVIEAGENSAGTVHSKINTIKDDIKLTKEIYHPDFIFVSLHWGIEFNTTPEKSDQDLAHRIIDSGADVVIGHHPHVLQGIEIYKEKVIFYSLGNFVFDMFEEVKRESMIVKLFFHDNQIISMEILPVIINKKEFYPSVVVGTEANRILGHINEYSEIFNTKMEYNSVIGKIFVNQSDKD